MKPIIIFKIPVYYKNAEEFEKAEEEFNEAFKELKEEAFVIMYHSNDNESSITVISDEKVNITRI